MTNKFRLLAKQLSKLPGIGPRQAMRLVLAMVEWPKPEVQALADALAEITNGPVLCKQCFNFTDDELCHICASHRRDQTKIAVVEKITDLESMEKASVFQGVYHVLGGVINPAEGILPEKLKIKELKERIHKLMKLTPDIELIIATNPNAEGETTAKYLEEELKSSGVKTTRLARGLSAGSSLEYADETTLANALKNRR
ncbi:MAG: recombination mediator RecR [Minisyncoccia bacterium]|jgi:recombination protein RecR